MRNVWRAIKLFEELPHYGVKLHLASIDKTIDIRTPDGCLNAYLHALMDDIYALDARRRAVDSVVHRKRKGESIGIPPFGTIRDQNGHLIPAPYGAWFMPDGSFQAGEQGEDPPHPEAVWRSYYDCAQLILETYVKGLHGYDWIARELNRLDSAFRDRWNEPRPLTLDDVRRVTSAWREYAGLVLQGKAQDRIAAKIDNPTTVLRDTGHAVFDLEFLRQVVQGQQKRSIVVHPAGPVHTTYIFPLTDLLYCAHCEAEAVQTENPRLRSRIIGHQKHNQRMRYRHSERRRCGCESRSVLADEVEGDFTRLIDVLQVHPEVVNLMAELAIHSKFGGSADEDEAALEEQKKVAIAKHRRALKNNLMLFQDGEIGAEECFNSGPGNGGSGSSNGGTFFSPNELRHHPFTLLQFSHSEAA